MAKREKPEQMTLRYIGPMVAKAHNGVTTFMVFPGKEYGFTGVQGTYKLQSEPHLWEEVKGKAEPKDGGE